MININQRKRKFLEWLLNHYQHENPSVNYLLNYLMTQPDIISIITFSDQVSYSPRGLYISFQAHTNTPFIYYKDHMKYTLSEQAFHDLRFSHRFADDRYYIECDIPQMYQRLYYFDVFEENPYAPHSNKETDVVLDTQLNTISFDIQMKRLKEAIDQALDQNQFDKVEYYLTQLENLKGTNDES